MRFLSILIGKVILKTLRLIGRNGSALPGLVIEKINPKFLHEMLTNLPQGVIVITGTNGKTTTTKVVAELLHANGLKVLTNKTGSNFVRGTVTTVIDKANLNGKLPYDIAIFEQDEAHAVHFVRNIKPRGVVVLNIMRDQMDRFGEIDTTAKLLQKVVASATEWVVLNANDERVAKLKPDDKVQTIWYGHSKDLQSSFLTDDELHHQDNTTYTLAGHMASELVRYDANKVGICLNGKVQDYKTHLTGSHNAINLAAALAVVQKTVKGLDATRLVTAVANLQPAFGRGEAIELIDGGTVTLQLIKNPGGFTHALRMLEINTYGTVGVVINDNYADGRDVSWLWDVDFGILENSSSQVLCGGSRGYDMAVRLKYDGVKVTQTNVDISLFVGDLNATVASSKSAIIFCTYTAMLKIRAEYKKYSKDMMKVSV